MSHQAVRGALLLYQTAMRRGSQRVDPKTEQLMVEYWRGCMVYMICNLLHAFTERVRAFCDSIRFFFGGRLKSGWLRRSSNNRGLVWIRRAEEGMLSRGKKRGQCSKRSYREYGSPLLARILVGDRGERNSFKRQCRGRLRLYSALQCLALVQCNPSLGSG